MTMQERIRPPDCACDRPEGLKKLVSVETALQRIRDHLTPIKGEEQLDLPQTQGRILAAPVTARRTAPAFDNSAMDGYALDPACLTGQGPWSLPLSGRLPAGQMPKDPLMPGTALQVFTGAPIPVGAKSVIMQEDVIRTGDHISITTRPPEGAHIRRAGEDMTPGDLILDQGSPITPRAMAALAAAGQTSATIRRKLRVALLLTGDEVQTGNSADQQASIPDLNGPMLSAALNTPAIDLVEVTHCPDQRAETEARLSQALAGADLVVTTGGISVGEEDHVKSAITALGGQMIFSGVALKPGKPVSLARVKNTLWLGLPGNPLSAFVTWQIFGTRILDQLTGRTTPSQPMQMAVTDRDISRKATRAEYRLAQLTGVDPEGRAIATLETATHSGRVATLAKADGLIHLPSGRDQVPKGALLDFHPFQDH